MKRFLAEEMGDTKEREEDRHEEEDDEKKENGESRVPKHEIQMRRRVREVVYGVPHYVWRAVVMSTVLMHKPLNKWKSVMFWISRVIRTPLALISSCSSSSGAC